MPNKKLKIALASLVMSGCQAFSGSKTNEENTLELYEITPLAPVNVTESTVIQASLKYNIKDFEKGKYFIIAQFETCTPNLTYDGDMPESEYAYPESSNGKIEFKFPIKYVWNQEIISRPYIVRFYLNMGVAGESSEVMAKTGPVIYATENKN